MGVPKKHTTKSHRNKRRMNVFLKEPSLNKCPKCGRIKLPHRVCQNCGFYKEREVLNVLAKLEKREKKIREREIRQTEKEAKRQKPMTMEELSKQKF